MSNPSDTKTRLLDIATELIWKNNYDTVGIAEICKQAGVTKGAFYHHFTSKADLFLNVCLSQRDCFDQQMEDMLSSRFSPQQQLENFIRHLLDKQQLNGIVQIRGCPIFTAGAQASCEDESIRAAAKDMSCHSIRYYIRLVENLDEGDCLEHPVDAEQTGRLIHEFIEGLWLHGRMHQNLEQLHSDLRIGLYRLTSLRPEYQKPAIKMKHQAAITAAQHHRVITH